MILHIYSCLFLLISFLSIRIFTWISSSTDYPGINRESWRHGKTKNHPKPLSRKCLARVHWRPGCHLWQHSFVDCRRPRWKPFYLELLGAHVCWVHWSFLVRRKCTGRALGLSWGLELLTHCFCTFVHQHMWAMCSISSPASTTPRLYSPPPLWHILQDAIYQCGAGNAGIAKDSRFEMCDVLKFSSYSCWVVF